MNCAYANLPPTSSVFPSDQSSGPFASTTNEESTCDTNNDKHTRLRTSLFLRLTKESAPPKKYNRTPTRPRRLSHLLSFRDTHLNEPTSFRRASRHRANKKRKKKSFRLFAASMLSDPCLETGIKNKNPKINRKKNEETSQTHTENTHTRSTREF